MGWIIGIAIAVTLVYAAGYSAGKQSIRDKFSKLMNNKGRRS
jgi:hypothetical protein